MKIRYLIPILLPVFPLACSQQEVKHEDGVYAVQDFAPPPAVEEIAYMKEESAADEPPTQDAERKLIRQATLVFQVDDLNRTYDSIKQLLPSHHAYTSDENREDLATRLEQTLEIRVEEKSFDTLIKRIETFAKKLDNRSIDVKDVTSEYIDVEARLKTKKALESRYYDILRQAHTVKDMLAIEEQLGNVRGDIESMESQLKYMGNRIRYSTITLTFSQYLQADDGFSAQLAGSLRTGWSNLVHAVLGIISFWPLIGVVVGAILFLTRLWKRRKNNILKTEADL